MRSEQAIGVLALLSLSPGCGGGDCTEAGLCDIRTRSCQQQTMETVACLRGRELVKLPEVRVVSESGLQRLIDEDRAMSDEDMRSEEEQAADFSHWSRGLSLLGLSPANYGMADADRDSVSEIAAVYRSSSKQILIVDRGKPSDDRRAVEVLAHETVHAMQDAELDLEAYRKRWTSSYDERLAVRALTEGEAVLYELLVLTALEGRTPEQLNWQGFFDEWRSDTFDEADADEAPVTMANLRFPYAFGGGYVFQHWLERGRVGVDQLFEQPPRSTVEVMFGASQPEVLNARAELLETALPSLGESYQTVGWFTAGTWIARQYTARLGLFRNSLIPAKVLLADMLSIHYDSERDHVVAAWKVRVASDEDRRAWLTGYVDSSAFAGWRTAEEHNAYLLVEENENADDSRVVLVDTAELQWKAPPRSDADDEDSEDSRALHGGNFARHGYAATRPLPDPR